MTETIVYGAIAWGCGLLGAGIFGVALCRAAKEGDEVVERERNRVHPGKWQ